MPGLLDFGTAQPAGGLLGDLFNDPGARLGMQLLAAGSPRMRGLADVMAQQDHAKQQALQQQYLQAQLEDRTLQTQARQAQMQAAQRKQEALPSLFSGGGVVDASGAVGDSTAVPQGMQSPQASLNWQRALQAGYTPDEIQKLAGLQNIGRQEVARTIETTDAQGRPITVQFDKFGNRIGDGLAAWKAPVMVNQGAQITAVDPATLQARGSFGVSMSPAERDAAARGWAGQALAREKFNLEQQQGGKPTFNAEAGGFIVPPSQNNPQGGIIPLQGFQKPLNDVQAKAQLFGTRMQEADKILADLEKGGKSFSTPGANAPFIGGLVNTLNSEQGQMLDQAKRDFTNAVLRRESGAAIAPSEFDSADKQYFPQYGDSKKVIEQKARARQIAIQGILSEVPKGTPPINVDGKGGSKQVVKTGLYGGKKVVQYSDGSVDYAD